MMVVRGGGPASGYIASAFFGGMSIYIIYYDCLDSTISLGLTLGRVVLLGVNKKVSI
jgi:hypothetical protein